MTSIIKKSVIAITSKICTKMAYSVSASACYWASYQPEEPKCLRK